MNKQQLADAITAAEKELASATAAGDQNRIDAANAKLEDLRSQTASN